MDECRVKYLQANSKPAVSYASISFTKYEREKSWHSSSYNNEFLSVLLFLILKIDLFQKTIPSTLFSGAKRFLRRFLQNIVIWCGHVRSPGIPHINRTTTVLPGTQRSWPWPWSSRRHAGDGLEESWSNRSQGIYGDWCKGRKTWECDCVHHQLKDKNTFLE